MKIRFKDGTEKNLTANPVEQKLFRNGTASGWVLNMALADVVGEETDSLLSDENISEFALLTEDDVERVKIRGYQKVSAITIRHSDTQNIAEIQLSKGV